MKNQVIDINIKNLSELTLYYQSECIDLPLYKGLMYIYTYKLTAYDRKGYTNTHKMRLKSLWDNFAMWYRLSNCKLTFTTLLRLYRVCKQKTFYNDMRDYTATAINKAYKQRFYEILNKITGYKQQSKRGKYPKIVYKQTA